MKISKLSVLTAAALAITASHAANSPLITFPTGNGSLAFIALNADATPTSIIVNLKLRLNDAQSDSLPTDLFSHAGNVLQWDFVQNTFKENGVSQAGSYAYSAPYNFFQAVAGAATPGTTMWGVIAGQSGGYPNNFLTTADHVLTAADKAAQQGAETGSMSNVSDKLYAASNLKSSGGNANIAYKTTLRNAGANLYGAFAETGGSGQADGYVGENSNFGLAGNWGGATAFNALSAEGSTQVPFYLLADTAPVTINKFPGTFSYNSGVLTYTVPVPEPETYALLTAGLLTLGYLRRRRG